jgi:hypothetical protein
MIHAAKFCSRASHAAIDTVPRTTSAGGADHIGAATASRCLNHRHVDDSSKSPRFPAPHEIRRTCNGRSHAVRHGTRLGAALSNKRGIGKRTLTHLRAELRTWIVTGSAVPLQP